MEKGESGINPRQGRRNSPPPRRSKSDISPYHHYHHQSQSLDSKSSPMSPQEKRFLQKPSSSSSSLSHLPKEQGRILSLLDNFGFIYCAQRPCDLFFHYSEYKGGPLGELNIGDEVEFFIGPSSQQQRNSSNNNTSEQTQIKLSAWDVHKLQDGHSISWQVEVEPKTFRRQGIVQRPVSSRHSHISSSSSSTGNVVGKIQLINKDQDYSTSAEQHEEQQKEKQQQEIEILYQASDILDSTIHLEKEDVVEFTLIQESRTKFFYAKNIIRILSKREQVELEKERLLLQTATLEQGIVISLHGGGYGFLKSNKRKEDVYFKYCHVLLPESINEEDTSPTSTTTTTITLREGQEMEFLVVSEVDKKDNTKKILSARQIQFLEKGSVIFEQVVAKNVTGTIETCPSIIQDNNNMDRRNHNYTSTNMNENKGRIILDTPISFIPPESKDPNTSPLVVSEVYLLARDSPGGILYPEPSQASLWIRPGDRLMFDVVWDCVDSSCRVAPMQVEQTSMDMDDVAESSSLPPPPLPPSRVRLISLSSENRVQGYVTSLKDNYGFLRLPDENTDIYFKISDVFPSIMQEDMDTALCIEPGKEHPPLRVGNFVSFDVSTQVRAEQPKRKGKVTSMDKELVCAQRIKIMSATIHPKKGWGVVTEINHDTCCGIISSKTTGEQKKCPVFQFSFDQILSTDKDIKMGVEVIYECQETGKDDVPTATKIRIVPAGSGSTLVSKEVLLGYILLEPSLSRTSQNSSKTIDNNKADVGNGRWKNVQEDFKEYGQKDGCILLIYDSCSQNLGSTIVNNSQPTICGSEYAQNISVKEKQTGLMIATNRTTLSYNPSSLLHRRTGKRGDLVAFTRDKNGTLKNVRVIKESAAQVIRGVIKRTIASEVIAVFNDNDDHVLTEILGCSLDSLKENESVEGILYEGIIYGICRTSDLYLSSKSYTAGLPEKERSRLNLTVKKELKDLGSKIIAQSSMAKGPDDSKGFTIGWTTRKHDQNHQSIIRKLCKK